jgi:hypothetical protein
VRNKSFDIQLDFDPARKRARLILTQPGIIIFLFVEYYSSVHILLIGTPCVLANSVKRAKLAVTASRRSIV